ncbi:restriction endonuclease subunit S [Streptomyces sp. NPDC088554]|uniref:restriction endonuclease subunit S n=1 Tax=Streptomyces sp. NPDC088554 TaxID=3365865 RepID=UPI00382B8E42
MSFSTWRETVFGELASSDRSAFSMGPFGSKITKENYIKSGIPVVRGGNLSGGIFLDDDFVYISPEKADDLKSANVEPGDLIFTHRGTIGQVSMIPRNPRYSRYVIGSSQVKCRLDESLSIPEFYYYWFQSHQGQRSILAHVSTVGVPGIATPLTSIRGLKVPCPSRGEQQAIVEVLGALDDKIAANRRIIVTVEDLLQSRFAQCGLDREVVSSADSVMVEELIEFNPKVPKPHVSEAVYVDMAALPTVSARVTRWGVRSPSGGARFVNGDTVMARITPCLENGKTAFVDFMKSGEIGFGSTEFIVMRSRAGIPEHFSYLLARSPRFRAHAIASMTGSSGRQRCQVDRVVRFLMNRPKLELLEELRTQCDSSFRMMKSLDAESDSLAELRDTLLPLLISGKLRVKDAVRTVEEAV